MALYNNKSERHTHCANENKFIIAWPAVQLDLAGATPSRQPWEYSSHKPHCPLPGFRSDTSVPYPGHWNVWANLDSIQKKKKNIVKGETTHGRACIWVIHVAPRDLTGFESRAHREDRVCGLGNMFGQILLRVTGFRSSDAACKVTYLYVYHGGGCMLLSCFQAISEQGWCSWLK